MAKAKAKTVAEVTKDDGPKTRYCFFKGEAAYLYLGKPDKYGSYKISLKATEELADNVKQAGIQIDTGGDYITFRRKENVLIKGESVAFAPPRVIDTGMNELDPFVVGKGSMVTCKVAVYPTIKGNGHRLEAVRVDELVENNYNDGEYNDDWF